MFHRLKIALRNIRRNGIYSVINIGGLAVGMAVAMLIMFWVYSQWSYDRFHEKADRLYSVWNINDEWGGFEWTTQIIGPTLVQDYPEIADMARYKSWQQLISYNDKRLNMELAQADPGFLTMFSFPLLQGDAHTALNDPYSILLTEEAARRLFGNEDPMGKTVTVQAQFPMTVTGILANLPANTRFQFDVVRPFLFIKAAGLDYSESWWSYSTATYIELQSGAKVADVNFAIRDVIKQHTNDNNKSVPLLYPAAKWHLYSVFENGQIVGGRIKTVRMFALIALLVLLIACINFMNLSTARSAKRSREIGVRKVMGARKKTLIGQFLGESVLTAAIAGVLAILLVLSSLPFFNILMGGQLHLSFGSIGLWIALFVFILLTGILAGSYPAFYLSSFLPVKVLKNVFKERDQWITPRKLLVITQFTFAAILIVATLVIHRQIQYAQNRDAGYNRDQLITIGLSEQKNKNQALIRQELLRTEAATSMTRTMSYMTNLRANTGGVNWAGKSPDDRTMISLYYVDAGWSETTGVKILQGRDIDMYTYATDSTAVLLNEAAVKLMGFNDPIGQIIQDSGKDWHVVGVVGDFVLESPYNPVSPMIIGGPAGFFETIHIKLNGANAVRDNLAKIEQIFRTYDPDYPFEYTFVDETYARKFAEEQRTSTLVSWFAGLAIFISCLGLFGLSAYMAENRRKEIGVRKVLGASVVNITSLLSREFLILVTISLLIAIPVAWWATSKWLNGYAYRTNIPWWLFAVVAILTIGIALFTVSWQAIKAARTNPINSIKTE